ncbi:MAG TPA: hypothetical protein VIX82_03865 [Solirubrobacteraceae bacterium]
MRRATVMTLCGLALLAPAAASASGGPVPPVLGGAGVSLGNRPFNFIAVAAGPNTLVERVLRAGGTVDASNLLRGSYGVPGVGADGSSTGLAADGQTLVLTRVTSSYPSAPTELVVLDASSTLKPRARILLPGSFTVDAISPTGRWLYLVHYRSPLNITDYEVRAYDLARRQLIAKPIVDPRNPREKMHGQPLTRTMSSDGRWAYTLYQSFNGAPFIHALDTAARRAFCVDLPTMSPLDLSSVKLTLSGAATLRISTAGTTQAVMDTRTFAVRSPNVSQPAPTRSTPTGGGDDSGILWALGIGLPVAAVALVVLLARRRRQTSIARPPIAQSR